jgi:hypothetical protein
MSLMMSLVMTSPSVPLVMSSLLLTLGLGLALSPVSVLSMVSSPLVPLVTSSPSMSVSMTMLMTLLLYQRRLLLLASAPVAASLL